MRDVESWIGFFDKVDENGGKSDFLSHFATGILLTTRDQAIGPIQCVVFGRVRFLDQIRYRLRITYLGNSANGGEGPFEADGVIEREEDVEGEWTFQLVLEIDELTFDEDLVIRAEAWIDDEVATAHLKLATSTSDLNALTPLLQEPSTAAHVATG